jgi:hypothetical protein
MAIYALIHGNTVDNIIVADNKETTEKMFNCILVEVSNEKPASIGCIWDGENFIAPEVIDEASPE